MFGGQAGQGEIDQFSTTNDSVQNPNAATTGVPAAKSTSRRRQVAVHWLGARQAPQRSGKHLDCNTREPCSSSSRVARFPETMQDSYFWLYFSCRHSHCKGVPVRSRKTPGEASLSLRVALPASRRRGKAYSDRCLRAAGSMSPPGSMPMPLANPNRRAPEAFACASRARVGRRFSVFGAAPASSASPWVNDIARGRLGRVAPMLLGFGQFCLNRSNPFPERGNLVSRFVILAVNRCERRHSAHPCRAFNARSVRQSSSPAADRDGSSPDCTLGSTAPPPATGPVSGTA